MKVVDLVEKFKDRNNKSFNFLLNEVSNYVMYEQSMIKKDSFSNRSSTIKYRYDEESYRKINAFISDITFLSKPVIGKGKKVIIKDMPEELMYELKHEMSFSDKIYILDKIKDTFMHLELDETMYDFDFSDGSIVLKNKGSDYSLECRIPNSSLYKFNRYMKKEYDKSAVSTKWFEKYVEMMIKYSSNESSSNNRDRNIFFRKLRKKILASRNQNNYILNYGGLNPEQKRSIVERFNSDFYESYHTSSYVASLVSSLNGANYPLLDNIYDFEISCSNESLKNKVKAIFNKLEGFYKYAYLQGERIPYDTLVKELKKLIYTINEQNNVESGLLVDLSFVHNLIIKNFIRNARSHANLSEIEGSTMINNRVIYHDISYNSYLNGYSEKSIPSFVMVGSKDKFDSLFDEVINNSKSNAELFNQMTSQYDSFEEDAYEPFFKQLEGFINFAFKMYESDYEITNNSYLNTPVGNASNFVDFLRKIINGTFEYEDGKGIGQR